MNIRVYLILLCLTVNNRCLIVNNRCLTVNNRCLTVRVSVCLTVRPSDRLTDWSIFWPTDRFSDEFSWFSDEFSWFSEKFHDFRTRRGPGGVPWCTTRVRTVPHPTITRVPPHHRPHCRTGVHMVSSCLHGSCSVHQAPFRINTNFPDTVHWQRGAKNTKIHEKHWKSWKLSIFSYALCHSILRKWSKSRKFTKFSKKVAKSWKMGQKSVKKVVIFWKKGINLSPYARGENQM